MTQQASEPLTELKLSDQLKTAVNESFTGGNPIIVAYTDENGAPSMSYRGSALAFSDTQLAIWARNPAGGIQKALAKNPRMTMLFRNPGPDGRAMIQFRGTAKIDSSDAARDKIYTEMPEPERNSDKEKKGDAIILDLERVDGFMPGARLAMRK